MPCVLAVQQGHWSRPGTLRSGGRPGRGDASEPIRFDVDRLRNDRTYVTRAVVAEKVLLRPAA